jgi:hypothetical protein
VKVKNCLGLWFANQACRRTLSVKQQIHCLRVKCRLILDYRLNGTVVNLRTTRFKNRYPHLDRRVFVMKAQYVFCEVGTGCVKYFWPFSRLSTFFISQHLPAFNQEDERALRGTADYYKVPSSCKQNVVSFTASSSPSILSLCLCLSPSFLQRFTVNMFHQI